MMHPLTVVDLMFRGCMKGLNEWVDGRGGFGGGGHVLCMDTLGWEVNINQCGSVFAGVMERREAL